jgi:hypothetical protein
MTDHHKHAKCWTLYFSVKLRRHQQSAKGTCYEMSDYGFILHSIKSLLFTLRHIALLASLTRTVDWKEGSVSHRLLLHALNPS